VDVLIATPGRMLDHFQRGRLMLMGVEILVIDEADRMLDMGFIPDIEKICKLLPPKRQTLFFSATMPPEITRLVNTFLNDPLRIEVARPATTAATITQRFVYCPDGEDFAKREALRELIRGETVRNAIIFCNRKRDVAIVHKSLVKHGFNAGALHGDMDQSSRTATLDKFRNGEIAFLAASDVAARGLDIPDVSHVFNYDVPWQADDYVHRIGRTGRAGKLGFSASLVSGEDFKALAEIEKITGEKAVWVGHAPTEEEIADGAKRKRGRGGRAGASGGASRGGSDRAAAGRSGADRGGRSGADRGERSAGRGRGDRPPRRSEEGPASVDAAGEGGPAISAGSHDAPRRPRLGRRPRGGDQPAQAAVAPAGDGQQQQQRAEQPRQDQPRQDRGRSERGRGDQPRAEGSGGRQRSARQPRQDGARQDRGGRDQTAGEQPAVQALASEPRREAQHESSPRPERGQERGPERVAERGPRDPAHSVRDRQQTRREAPRHNQDSGPNQGFADNVPAFLRRPVKAK
jgi:superfamily II DNA/RNA helicase